MTTRSARRSRDEVAEASEPTSARQQPKKKRKKTQRPPVEQPDEQQPEDGDASDEQRPSGYPFIDAEVEWEYERIELLSKPHKLIPAGYESMAGDVNAVLRTLPISKADLVRRSAMGEYTRLEGLTTRCCNMLHYVVCHQVTPTPNFDPTSLFFKFDNKVVRLSRVEYALVSGLKFGPANFNPYMKHELPEDSMFERLFGADENTTLADVRLAYMNKEFKVNNTKVTASQDDYVRLSKFLLALGFALGFDATKKKIPLWLWVLIEDDKEWEEFPWGSLSFQIMMAVVKGVKKTCTTKKMNYTLKGNTVAFSAWIFEAIPTFGKAVGIKQPDTQIPRFLHYSYVNVKKGKYPTEEVIKEGFNCMLEPSIEECDQPFWKSLESEPSEDAFAFYYDHAHSKKKQEKDDNDDEELDEHGRVGPELTPAQLEVVADATAKKVLGQLKAILDEYHDKLDHYHEKLVDDVAERVTTKLLDRAPRQDEMEHDDNWRLVGQIVQEYDKDDKSASTGKPADEGHTLVHSPSAAAASSQPEKTSAAATQEPVTPTGHVACEESTLEAKKMETDALEAADDVQV